MKKIARPAATLLLAAVLCLEVPSIAHAEPVSPSRFSLCQNPLFGWLCPR